MYERRKRSLGPEDRTRLELEEERIAAGEEDYRALDELDVRMHSFDDGFIAFRPLDREHTLLVAFRLIDRPRVD